MRLSGVANKYSQVYAILALLVSGLLASCSSSRLAESPLQPDQPVANSVPHGGDMAGSPPTGAGAPAGGLSTHNAGSAGGSPMGGVALGGVSTRPGGVVTSSRPPEIVGLDAAPPGSYPAGPKPGSKTASQLQVFYATDRKYDAAKLQFTGMRGNGITYGTALVNVPASHVIGEVDKHGFFSRSHNPGRDMFVVGLRSMPATNFFQELNADLRLNPHKRTAFIFIHGFNNTFEDAALRTAQMAVDLDIPTVPVFYSWPSEGKVASYPADEANVEWTQERLKKFLEDFADKSAAQEIYIIAHSMGNRAATRALTDLLAARTDLRTRYTQVILAAPDIDADTFKNVIAPKFQALKTRVTMYASANDRAIELSKKVHHYPRAGDANGSIIVVSGIESIDASKVPTNFMGHDYFVSNRALLTDISMLLKSGLTAKQRSGLRGKPAETPEYWIFP